MVLNLSPELIKRAEEIYDRLKPVIEKKNYGQYIAIDPISNEYFIANKLAAAIIDGKNKLPGREFFTRRIGLYINIMSNKKDRLLIQVGDLVDTEGERPFCSGGVNKVTKIHPKIDEKTGEHYNIICTEGEDDEVDGYDSRDGSTIKKPSMYYLAGPYIPHSAPQEVSSRIRSKRNKLQSPVLLNLVLQKIPGCKDKLCKILSGLSAGRNQD